MIWVLDYKAASGIWESHRIQVATYFDTYGKADRAGIILLDKKTGMHTFEQVDRLEERYLAFLNLRNYYRFIVEPTLTDKKMDGFYVGKTGNKYPRITGILDLLKIDALPQWSANLTVDYFKEHIGEMLTPEQQEYHFKVAKTAYREVSKAAMNTGSIVHGAIHAYLSGAKPEPIIGDNKQAETAFLGFLEWKDTVNLKPIEMEKVVVNEEEEYGGTIDLIAEMDDVPISDIPKPKKSRQKASGASVGA